MFIKEIVKKNPGYDKTFTTHRLMESVRTPNGPRQRKIIDLGKLDIPKDDFKTLANRIEELLSHQQSFLSPPDPIESLARHYAGLIRQKEMTSLPDEPEAVAPHWETVDLNSLSQGECRTIGGEAIAWDAFNQLGIPHLLSDLGFHPDQIHQAALLVIGRLLHPASERETACWGKEISALGELMGTDFRHLSNNALYRTSDRLLQHKEAIERRLWEREREWLGLGEKIILYDLTNTYLTGSAHESALATRGRSKQKRHDCPLVTLALAVDEEGFPKGSQVLPGKVSEPETLQDFLRTLQTEGQLSLLTEPRTLVMDAGIGTGDNLREIRAAGFHYITVSRSRPKEIPEEGLIEVNRDKDATVEVKRLDGNGEVILYCQSSARAAKEESMKDLFQQRFEEGLKQIAASLSKKRGRKRYDAVMKRLGRLTEKYPTVAQFYRIEVKEEKGRATEITWFIDKEKELEVRFAGSYYIRSSRTDLDEKELWSLYMMLTTVEEGFRCLKSELGMRPMYHRLDKRLEGHLFISVLAYHLMATIRRRLHTQGISLRWDTIRNRMATQMRVTASLTNEKGKRIHFRQTTDPEPFHYQVHRALGVPPRPVQSRRSEA